MQTTWEITEVAELEPLANAVGEALTSLQERQDGGAAAVLALHGDLGAGKTTFMQTFAKTLGVTETVTSPTFVVMKTYELMDQPWEQLVHMDAYRLETLDELRPLHFAELLTETGNLICIEWAENIAAALPVHTLHLTFTLNGETRTVTIND